ncbi:MAG: HdeD family acid-resistance protein [Ruegeria sp.]|uniref:HdeD family acid-resistance protein n=1 Tax=Ruegeria sp. TaxID=1879320 RepID=UPI00349E59DF
MTLSEPTGSKEATTALPATTELRPVWIIVLGALTVLTGIAAIAFPLASTLAVEVLVGSLFLTVGVFTTTHAIIDRGSEGMWWELLIGLLHIAAGVIFLTNPLGGILALTVMLGATFVAEGVLRIFMALRMERSRKLFLLIASGALSILLGGMVFAGLANGASLMLIGVLLGANFIFAGVALITVGMAAKTSGSD